MKSFFGFPCQLDVTVVARIFNWFRVIVEVKKHQSSRTDLRMIGRVESWVTDSRNLEVGEARVERKSTVSR